MPALSLAALSLGLAHAAAPAGFTLETDSGPLVVERVYHGTVRMTVGGRTVWVDPWSKAPLEGAPAGSLVLITDLHPDHLDPAALDRVAAPGARVVAPPAVHDKLAADGAGKTRVTDVLANGQQLTLDGLKLTAVPMYNHSRGPEPGKLYHDKGRGNGYLVEWGGKRLYIAGDTACTDEMKALQGVDHALVPMNLPYTMPPDEAAACVAAFAPKRVTPYHHAGSDLAVFSSTLAATPGGAAVEVVPVEAYPGGLPW